MRLDSQQWVFFSSMNLVMASPEAPKQLSLELKDAFSEKKSGVLDETEMKLLKWIKAQGTKNKEVLRSELDTGFNLKDKVESLKSMNLKNWMDLAKALQKLEKGIAFGFDAKNKRQQKGLAQEVALLQLWLSNEGLYQWPLDGVINDQLLKALRPKPNVPERYANLRLNNAKFESWFFDKVDEIARDLETRPERLLAVMAFETGGTFSLSIQNPTETKATGLIQFITTTASDLLDKESWDAINDLKKMSQIQQLDYVKKYLVPFKGMMDSVAKVYASIAFGRIKKGDSEVYCEKNGINQQEYRNNFVWDANKDGKIDNNDLEKFLSTNSVYNVYSAQFLKNVPLRLDEKKEQNQLAERSEKRMEIQDAGKIRYSVPKDRDGSIKLYLPGDRSTIDTTLTQKHFADNIQKKGGKSARVICEWDPNYIYGDFTTNKPRYDKLITNFPSIISTLKNTLPQGQNTTVEVVGHSRWGIAIDDLVGKYPDLINKYVILDGTYYMTPNLQNTTIPGEIYYIENSPTAQFAHGLNSSRVSRKGYSPGAVDHESIVNKVLFG